jgi:hypothetical protein
MDADVQLHGGAVLHLHDVQIGPRAVTATTDDGRKVSWPKDRLLAQKVLVALERTRGRRRRATA